MTAGEAARITALELKNEVGEESLREAQRMAAALLGVSLPAFSMHRGMELSREQLLTLADWTERRKQHEPLQYILGQWSFYGYEFLVDPNVLIPRPETEELAERAIRRIQERRYQSVLDLCTGSGCIAVAIKKETGAAVTATDLSKEALEVARTNAELNEAAITFSEGDLFEAVGDQTFDCIVSNPPYLSDSDMEALQEELTYEPRTALYGGADGLELYRRIAGTYGAHLNPGGTLFLEIGADQGAAVQALFPGAALYQDLGGNPRMVVQERRPRA